MTALAGYPTEPGQLNKLYHTIHRTNLFTHTPHSHRAQVVHLCNPACKQISCIPTTQMITRSRALSLSLSPPTFTNFTLLYPIPQLSLSSSPHNIPHTQSDFYQSRSVINYNYAISYHSKTPHNHSNPHSHLKSHSILLHQKAPREIQTQHFLFPQLFYHALPFTQKKPFSFSCVQLENIPGASHLQPHMAAADLQRRLQR